MHDPESLATLKRLLEAGKKIVKRKCLTTLGGKIIATHAFDLNRDGVPEIIVSLKGGSVLALTSAGDVLWQFRTSENVFGIAAMDLGPDYGNNIAIGSDDCSIYLLDSKGQPIWTHKTTRWVSSVAFYSAPLPEQGLVCAGCDDGCVYGLDITGQLKWRFRSNGKIKRVRVADIDNDGSDELLAISYDKHIYVLDSLGHQKRVFHTKDQPGRDFYVADVDKDGLKELIVTTFKGYVYLFTNTGELKWRYKTRGKTQDSIRR